jgi:hypothetical protein
MSIYEIIPALDLTQSVHDIYKCMHRGMGGQILNLQNISDRDCDEIRLEIQTENFFRSLISRRLIFFHHVFSRRSLLIYLFCGHEAALQ